MSTLSKDELLSVMIDPIKAVSLMMDKVEQDVPDVVIVDASNPFTFMLETIAYNAAVLKDEQTTKYHRIYPTLANNSSTLYNNISYKDTKNIFSQPAYANIRFIINITNFNTVAEKGGNNEFTMASIPELSYISAEGYNFLVTNRIDIKRFNNGVFSIEQNVSSTDIGVSTLGVLPHRINTTPDGNQMLIFDTILKQLTRSEVVMSVNKTDLFTIKIPLTDKLHYISAINKVNGGSIPILVSYSEVIDPSIPTIIAKTLDNEVEITIPDTYILNDMISGNVVIILYTTKGVVDYPLNKLSSDKFSISFNGVEQDIYTSAITRVGIANTGLERLTGGTNGKTFEELKNSIISNSIGDTIAPVTSAQILDLVSRDGYYGYLLEDTITDRLYIASRTTPIKLMNTRNANIDLLYYKTTIIPSMYTNHPMIVVSDTSDDRLIIKPYTIFKKTNNGITPISVEEINTINNLPVSLLIKYLNENELLFSPYSYISSILNGVYSLRIVDFRPSIEGFSILSNNSTILARSNIQSYNIEKTNNGYQLKFLLTMNSEFEKLDLSKIKGQLRINIAGNNNIGVYFYSTLVDKQLVFNIDTEYYVDELFELSITNGISDLATKTIKLSDRLELITYIVDGDVEHNISTYANSRIHNETGSVTAITIEDVDVVFGVPITQLSSNMTVSYTDRKYLRYEENVYAVYEDVIYDTDSIGSLLTPNEDLTEVEYTILHNKGDYILDDEDNPIILHKKDDYILDQDGNPIIDRINGTIKYTDMLLLEYSLFKADKPAIDSIIDSLSSYYTDISSYRKILLEETNIKFKPFINTNSIKLRHNNTTKSINKNIKPEVELFIETAVTLSEEDLVLLRNMVGAVIHEHINKDMFYTVDIKEGIKENAGFPISAIRINLDRDNDTILSGMEKIVLADVTNRIRINKVVSNSLGGLNILYDVDVIVTKI